MLFEVGNNIHKSCFFLLFIFIFHVITFFCIFSYFINPPQQVCLNVSFIISSCCFYFFVFSNTVYPFQWFRIHSDHDWLLYISMAFFNFYFISYFFLYTNVSLRSNPFEKGNLFKNIWIIDLESLECILSIKVSFSNIVSLVKSFVNFMLHFYVYNKYCIGGWEKKYFKSWNMHN